MIKKFIFFSLTFLATYTGISQNQNFAMLKNIIHTKYPDLPLEDRIIAINYWSIKDDRSRENGKAFEKALSVYHGAILKNGREGLIVISVNEDGLSPEANIVLSKDNIKRSLAFTAEEFKNVRFPSSANIVFDSMGRELYRDLADHDVFRSIQKLITR